MAQIHELIGKIMSEIGAIDKTQRNVTQNFMFRGIDDVYNNLQPILAKYGVFSVPQVLSEVHEERTSAKGNALIYRIYKIKYTFYAPDGSYFEAIVMGEGMDSGDKAGNKSMAVAHKYAYVQVFSIPYKDMDDPDKESHEITPKQQDKKPQDKPKQASSASPVSDKQKAMLHFKMKDAGLSSDEEKLFFAFVNPQSAKEASEFIDKFDDKLKEWQDSQQSQVSKDDIPW
jgi:hypothetical protein